MIAGNKFIVMVGKLVASDPLAVKLDTFWLTVEVKNVTDSFAAAPEFHPETGPLVKVPPVYEPPAVELKFLEVFKAEWVFVSAIFAKALLTCAAVAPLLPAVNVKPAIVRVSPLAIDRKDTLADDEPLAVKLDTFRLDVELVKVAKLFVAAPEFHPETVPLVKVPPVYDAPAVELKLLEVFKAEWVFVSDIFAKALLTCAAVAPLLPAVNVNPAMVRVCPADNGLKSTEVLSFFAIEPRLS
jgi:hypothetical protein